MRRRPRRRPPRKSPEQVLQEACLYAYLDGKQFLPGRDGVSYFDYRGDEILFRHYLQGRADHRRENEARWEVERQNAERARQRCGPPWMTHNATASPACAPTTPSAPRYVLSSETPPETTPRKGLLDFLFPSLRK